MVCDKCDAELIFDVVSKKDGQRDGSNVNCSKDRGAMDAVETFTHNGEDGT